MSTDGTVQALVSVDGQICSRRVPRDNIMQPDDYSRFVRMTSVPLGSRDEPPTCVICLEPILPHEMIPRTACGHTVHTECMWPWVKTCSRQGLCARCPQCNLILFAPVLTVDQGAAAGAGAVAAAAAARVKCCVCM